MPKMTHPNSDQTIEPKREHATAYTSQGWVEAAKAEDADETSDE